MLSANKAGWRGVENDRGENDEVRRRSLRSEPVSTSPVARPRRNRGRLQCHSSSPIRNRPTTTSVGRIDMRNAPFEVRPIAGALGAELHGVDLAGDLPDATVGAIRQALLDHLVIFFRDQDLPPERFLVAGAPLRHADRISVRQGHRRLPGDHQRHQARARDGQLRRRVALRHDLSPGTADGHAAGRARGARGRRRHAVRQPVPRLRDAVGDAARTARRPEGRLQFGQGRCQPNPRGPHPLGRQRRGAQAAGGRASGGAHASGDRAQGALCQPRSHGRSSPA